VLSTHLPLALRLRIDKSYTTVATLYLHGMFQEDLHLCIYLYLVTKGDCHVKEQEHLDSKVS